MYHPTIPTTVVARLFVFWPGWVELEGPGLGEVWSWSWFGEGKVWPGIVPTAEGNAYLIGRRLTQHEFLPSEYHPIDSSASICRDD